jgi:hypothetical protein
VVGARKLEGVLNGYLFVRLLVGYEACLLSMRWLAKSQFQNEDHKLATLLVHFGAYMHILFLAKVRILVLDKWSFRSPLSPTQLR